jgi:hypothetical protein
MLCHCSLEEAVAASGVRDREFHPVLRAGVGVQADQRKIIEKKRTSSSRWSKRRSRIDHVSVFFVCFGAKRKVMKTSQYEILRSGFQRTFENDQI